MTTCVNLSVIKASQLVATQLLYNFQFPQSSLVSVLFWLSPHHQVHVERLIQCFCHSGGYVQTSFSDNLITQSPQTEEESWWHKKLYQENIVISSFWKLLDFTSSTSSKSTCFRAISWFELNYTILRLHNDK